MFVNTEICSGLTEGSVSSCSGGVIERDYYCPVCKECYYATDALKKENRSLGYKRFFCPECRSLLLRVCPFCATGLMNKPEFPVTGDFDNEGKVESFCDICGKGYLKFEAGCYNKISKADIDKLLERIFHKLGIALSTKREHKVSIFTKAVSRFDVIDYCVDNFGADPSYVEEHLRGQVFF